MILHTQSGAVIVANECHWIPGGAAYLSVTNAGGSGAILNPGPELDQLIDELTRIRASIEARGKHREEAA